MLLLVPDLITSILICFAVVFNPWAFGTTQTWSINVMNTVGCTLGVLWLFKLVLRQLSPQKNRRWVSKTGLSIRLLAVASFLVVLYCLISAVNARATYFPQTWEFKYHPVISWLPHSYDADRSWAMFWQNLGLAGLFWALRDWLQTMTPQEVWEFSLPGGSRMAVNTRLPAHLRLLLWVLAISGGLLAIQGILQRIGGGDKLLWLVRPSINGFTDIQFGAFPYRGNATQYFNLLWPVILGFFWMEFNTFKSGQTRPQASPRTYLLIAGAVFMAICPLVATSRAGAGVLILELGLAALVFWFASRQPGDQGRHSQAKMVIPVVAVIILTVGLLLGWSSLASRFKSLSVDAQERQALSQVGWEMSCDNPLFGTGPGSLETIYQLYMHGWADFWPAQLHNDWMEILATFGWVGFALIFACLVLAVTRWFSDGGISAEKYFVRLLWVSLAGCLLHARFDWPFECHAVLTLFLVLCAILSCLSAKPRLDSPV